MRHPLTTKNTTGDNYGALALRVHADTASVVPAVNWALTNRNCSRLTLREGRTRCKKNWELVRDILAALEGRDTTHGGLSPAQGSGFPPEVVSYHFYILNEAGLIEASCFKPISGPMDCVGRNLTWAGHEFLDSIRNDTTWNKIKTTAKSKGVDLSFEVIKQAAVVVIKGLLGAPT